MKKKGDNPMKTKEELNATKEEIKTENNQPRKLTEEELAQVSGGNGGPYDSGTAVTCYWCKQSAMVYKDKDVKCPHCGGLLRASLYE